jgi:hypothetical protein
VSVLALLILLGVALWRLGVDSLDTSSSDEEPVDLEALAALPYTNFVVESEERKKKVGVTLYDEAQAYPGVSLYCNHLEERTGALLIDMGGRVLHQWEAPDSGVWALATLDQNGNVYGVIYNGDRGRLVKMDWRSTVLYELPGFYHHDVQFFDDGSMVTLRRQTRNIPHRKRSVLILDDYLVFISPDGRIAKSISLFEVVRRQNVVQRILDEAKPNRRSRYALDILHTNTSDVLERDVPGFCRKGNILICMRNLDLILVYDHETDEIVWQHDGNGEWQHPHEPKLLPNGTLLIFDNGDRREWSRLIEMDPITKEIVWEYKGNPSESFYTAARGSIQRLPNGNTLVTESDTGRVFEVTRNGKIVWEWYNPLFSDEKRAIVYRMKRFEQSVVDAWRNGARHRLSN